MSAIVDQEPLVANAAEASHVGALINSPAIDDSTAVNVPTREQIARLQEEMSKFPQVELPTEHFFANGMYMRKLFLPAGTLAVGKVHKQEHFFVLVTGELTVWTEDGMKRIQPGAVIITKPGTKRAALAHADSTCITVHRTDSTDLDEIEAEIIEPEGGSLFDARNHLIDDSSNLLRGEP